MTASVQTEKRTSPTSKDDGKGVSRLFAVALAVSLAGLVAWCCFDHSLPSWDAAGHLSNGLSYRELFRHPRPFNPEWYHNLLTVNCFYPPLTYVFSGLLKTVLGTGLWTDSAVKVAYLAVLNVSVYALVSRLAKDKLAGILAMVAVNLYPDVTIESHKSMIDFPVMSMVALALATLCWWQEKVTWTRTAVLALATGCALMTKQVSAAFLLIPYGLFFLSALKDQQFKKSLMLAGAGITSGAMLVPWFIVSLPTIKRVAAEIQASLGNKAVSEVFFGNVVDFISFFPAMATPFLLGIAILGCLSARSETHRRFFVLVCSAVSGAIVLSTLTWQYALERYYISALILPAAYTGYLLSNLIRSRKPLWTAIAGLVLAIGVVQYLAVNFTPYPIAESPVSNMVRSLCWHPSAAGNKNRFENPCPDQDWGINWTLNQIRAKDGDATVWLNILPSTEQINVHTIEYFARIGKYSVHPTTSRTWSAAGDSSRFREEDALHYQWCLLKTGEQGFKFHDAKSREEFEQWSDFVRKSGKFALISEMQLPDGSNLSLYRQP